MQISAQTTDASLSGERAGSTGKARAKQAAPRIAGEQTDQPARLLRISHVRHGRTAQKPPGLQTKGRSGTCFALGRRGSRSRRLGVSPRANLPFGASCFALASAHFSFLVEPLWSRTLDSPLDRRALDAIRARDGCATNRSAVQPAWLSFVLPSERPVGAQSSTSCPPSQQGLARLCLCARPELRKVN